MNYLDSDRVYATEALDTNICDGFNLLKSIHNASEAYEKASDDLADADTVYNECCLVGALTGPQRHILYNLYAAAHPVTLHRYAVTHGLTDPAAELLRIRAVSKWINAARQLGYIKDPERKYDERKYDEALKDILSGNWKEHEDRTSFCSDD